MDGEVGACAEWDRKQATSTLRLYIYLYLFALRCAHRVAKSKTLDLASFCELANLSLNYLKEAAQGERGYN